MHCYELRANLVQLVLAMITVCFLTGGSRNLLLRETNGQLFWCSCCCLLELVRVTTIIIVVKISVPSLKQGAHEKIASYFLYFFQWAFLCWFAVINKE